MDKCCGDCKYHIPGEIPRNGDFVCNNAESDAYRCETMFNDECELFEEREDQ